MHENPSMYLVLKYINIISQKEGFEKPLTAEIRDFRKIYILIFLETRDIPQIKYINTDSDFHLVQ